MVNLLAYFFFIGRTRSSWSIHMWLAKK